jgi:SulP family sulfate permease
MEMALNLKNNKLVGDFWGGLASMLVALPSAIAFGVTIYAAIGPEYAGLGALAGILGTTALGLIAPTLGGTDRLITAPCAPAAAVCSAFAIELVQNGVPATFIVLMLTALGLVCGIVQLLLGFLGVGGLIKYIPFPVVSGYLSGVGLIIIGSQIPKFMGVMDGSSWWRVLISPDLWHWQTALIGAVTIAVMLGAPRFTRLVPAAILGLLGGVITYFVIAYTVDDSLLVMDGNSLIIGPLGGTASSMLQAITGRWHEIGELKLSQIGALLGTALTLGVLLSIDTLKTCVVLDTMTRSRHDSNRELIAQGSGNIASACVGGMPGAGQMGATLVNLTSGGQTRISGVIEGVLSLITFLALGSLIAWIPVASLAAILIVVGVRMIDRHSFHLLAFAMDRARLRGDRGGGGRGAWLQPDRRVGRRDRSGDAAVHPRATGQHDHPQQARWQPEVFEAGAPAGGHGTAGERMASRRRSWSCRAACSSVPRTSCTALEPELAKRTYILLDMRRVQSVDVTAVHLLSQIRDSLIERGAFLIFSNLARTLPNGRNIAELFDQMELTTMTEHVKVFP